MLSFDIGSFIFPSWTCAGDLTSRIAFNGLWPLLLMALLGLALLARKMLHKGNCQGVLLQSLEAAVFISFCVLPSVTRSLFLAFGCEGFGYDDLMGPSTKLYLTASLDVKCSTPEHGRIITLATVFVRCCIHSACGRL